MNPFIKKILIWGMGLLSPITSVCNINFADTVGNIAINPTTSKLYINNPAKVVGWSQRSVVKAFGDNASSSWLEAYGTNAVIGQTGQPNVTAPARTYLVEANSNAICQERSLLRTTSNLLLYTARTYSSSLFVLRSRADSTSRDVRTTSNAVNLLYRKMAVPIADAIDGTVFAKYVTNHYVFHNGAWNARGWVRFNNGFTIMPQGAVSMDTLTTVSGPIDLRDTGVLKLNNDLYLAHNVTLTAGGYIKGNAANYGQANTIFMGGDLTLAGDNYAKVLHITGDWANNGQSGDLIIDGCGHTLNIGSQAQIFVDTNVTLTLRNMTIKTSPASLMKPAIQLAALSSKLALDNVLFDLGADFQFDQGQIFIHDEVAVTGTSAFVYQSPKPSYITSGATWSFETGTTFSIAPSTYTDQPFTAGTATSNNFIVLADQSSALSLNNCSLKTTFTGARFTKGMVLFDNKVAIDTQAGVDLTMSATGVGLLNVTITVSGVSLSPDGHYLAAFALFDTSFLRIYRFNGTSLGNPIIPSDGDLGGNAVPTVTWSPDGKFLAVGGDGPVGLRIYRFTGTALTYLLNRSFGLIVNSISWSPDGRYLAVGGNNGTTPLIVYRFDGVSLTQMTTANPGGQTIQVNGVSWSPDGKYLAVTGRQPPSNPTYLQVYAFNGSQLSSIVFNNYNGNGCTVAWSPDSRFLAFGWGITAAWGTLYVLRFDGTASPPLVANIMLGSPIGQFNAAAWSPDGRYLLACGSNGGSGRFQLYRLDLLGAAALIAQDQPFGTIATTVAWSPDSKYVLIGGTNNTSGQVDLMSYPVTRRATLARTQGFSNGLLFGDKTKGSDFDANVNVLAGAVVKVKGMVKDDSA